jgi:aminoglycoside phosphotransferase (APT) family kinase protein
VSDDAGLDRGAGEDPEPAPIPGVPDEAPIQRSSRDQDVLRARLEQWLARRLPSGAEPRITSLSGTSANGMSSETLVFEASWAGEPGAEPQARPLVARLAPGEADVPVFSRYDLDHQFDTIRQVAELTDVPVPPPLWYEADETAVGAPFFVMGRVDGRVPPDVMPYNFGDSWLFDATPADQRHLQDTTVGALARLHAIDRPTERFAYLDPPAAGDSPLRRRLGWAGDWYRWAARDHGPSPLVERVLAWLDDHLPAHESDPVLCWGDSRIGNVIYDGFEPAAILDWEMATLGPPELDVTWLVYAHRLFEDIAGGFGLPGMPDFLRLDDVATTYEAASGRSLRDLGWYGTFGALLFAVVFLRIGARSVHFGEKAMPDDVDELITNRDGLERMLAGGYWG